MNVVTAYEHNGKIYKTPEEALKQELYEELTNLFANDGWHDIMRKIVNNKEVQDKLIELITYHKTNLEWHK